jgi:hypothetical protein
VPCKKANKHGVVEFGPMEQLNEAQPAPFIHIDNINGNYNFEDYDNLPNELNVGRYVYEKKMVIMSHPCHTTRDCGNIKTSKNHMLLCPH